ncbi:MAG: helix-turn-helix transcriptional regulator [Pseudonocardia sp.]|nr:helix-turn-helix transcriptional regulator [Pseudonocardia sp.]
MNDDTEVSAEDQAIGERVRHVRRRRGKSLETVAGLAGIHHSFLSRLERGERAFTRRGLLENLAAVLSCSVADLTGQPYLAPDPETAAATAAIPQLNLAFYDTGLDDTPDVPARPLPTLVAAAHAANVHADNVQYELAGRNLGQIITELQVIANTRNGDDRRRALAGLAEASEVAYSLARTTGHFELAVAAARRGFDAAERAERLDLMGLLAMSRSIALMRLGARRAAANVTRETLAAFTDAPSPRGDDTEIGEAHGMLHLTGALIAARDEDTTASDTHLEEARSLARHTGERNHLHFHFGPANVAAWELSLHVESGRGVEAAERFEASCVDVSMFGSRERESSIHFDLARGWAQAEGARDDRVIRALDTADRLAPVRVRNDALARDIVMDVDRRSKRRVWELDSLKNRLGVA